jgi:hypothetical protein
MDFDLDIVHIVVVVIYRVTIIASLFLDIRRRILNLLRLSTFPR